jgi:malonyl-CoA/methylmalonyl-CoA synthetase
MSADLATQAICHGSRTALITPGGSTSYEGLNHASARAAAWLLAGKRNLAQARVAYLVPPGADHVTTLLAIWRAGGVGVPLALSHPAAELEYVIRDAEAAIVVASRDREATVAPLAVLAGARFGTPEELAEPEPVSVPPVDLTRPAMIIYTSGTTGRPKGVVLSHANLAAQVSSMSTAWGWGAGDRILLILPLHHVHGIVNVLGTALWNGAVCEMPPTFDPEATWERLGSGELSLFMAVPTVYRKLIVAWDAAPTETRRRWSDGAGRLRLMVSGSAALPIPVLERWREITGHTLLERYGMTEIGMALSNPLEGERRPGFVGTPMPDVQVRLVDDAGHTVGPGTPGEIEVRGPTVFQEYWRRPQDTLAAFRDGWFRTGDVGIVEGGAWRLLGRTSIDIIKTGGYKVSALEVEAVLREHPAIAECAVVGVEDPEWGERICAAVELMPGTELSLEALQSWTRPRLAPYKIPRALLCLDALPRNPMGKVVKSALIRPFLDNSAI